jgi:PAS domain S-box-containing protein
MQSESTPLSALPPATALAETSLSQAQAEARLRGAEADLYRVLENSPLAVIEFDAQLRISRWSWAAERVFGWRAEEVLGKGMFEVPWVHCEDLERIRQVAEQLRSGQDPRNVTPNRNYRKDGAVIHCEWYNSSLLDEQGQLVSILSLVLDVTARVEAEHLLRCQAEHLEQLVNERTARLQDTVGELRNVSYSLAHDLRAPLRAMQGFAELAERRCGQCGEDLVREYHRRILVASRRLDLLVTDALNYTKILHHELTLTPVDLGALIRGLLDTYPNLAPGHVLVEIEGTLPMVLGNESFLTQCFANLLSNAVKFVAPGRQPRVRLWAEFVDSGELLVDRPAARTQASTPSDSQLSTLNHQLVRVWVEDNGIGIEPELHPRLFGMFERCNGDYEGTGIGLAIVRKAVERMGGTVGVESTPGVGSRFWVELRPAAS